MQPPSSKMRGKMYLSLLSGSMRSCTGFEILHVSCVFSLVTPLTGKLTQLPLRRGNTSSLDHSVLPNGAFHIGLTNLRFFFLDSLHHICHLLAFIKSSDILCFVAVALMCFQRVIVDLMMSSGKRESCSIWIFSEG